MINNVKPTVKQLAALEIKKANPDMPLGTAMIKAGYSETTAQAPGKNFLDRRGTEVAIEQYQVALSELGLTPKKLAEKTKEWIDAKKVVSARVIVNRSKPTTQSNGELPNANSMTDDFIEVPDYQTQLKAGEMLKDDLGLKTKDSPDNLKRKLTVEEFYADTE